MVTRVYTILVLISVAALASWGVYDWNERQKEAVEKNYAALRSAAGLMTELYKGTGTIPAAALPKLMKAKVLTDPRWKLIVLQSDVRGLEYYWGPKPSETLPLQADLTKVDIPAWKPQPWSDHLLQVKVYVPGVENYTLQGIYTFYSRTELFEFLKVCGFTLLGLLILTALLMLLLGTIKDSAEPEEERTYEPETLDLSEEEHPGNLNDIQEEAMENLPGLHLDQSEAAPQEEEFWFDEEPLESPDSLPPLKDDSPQTSGQEDPKAAPEQPAKAAPELFSPASGLSWETFLTQRLEFELDRCSRMNQDLSLLIFTGKGLENPGLYRSLGQEIGSNFSFKDLDFEMGQDKFVVVIPNQSFEKTMQDTNDFLRRVDKTLPQIFLRAGLSSRAGRLLRAEVLMKEAETALLKALSTQERVVGLKADPDRYRNHLQSQRAAGSGLQ